MSIDINHIAKLARLRIEEGQIERFARQMGDILSMVESLPELEGAAVGLSPEHPMRLRPDIVEPSAKREDILQNAPQVEAGCVVVPRVVE